jgi:hypothetical protein
MLHSLLNGSKQSLARTLAQLCPSRMIKEVKLQQKMADYPQPA